MKEEANSNKPVAEQHRKPRHGKSREVSSRFLSPLNTKPLPTDHGISSPISRDASPPAQHRKSTSSTAKQRSQAQEDSGFTRGGLWPASTAPTKRYDTLADHLGNERLKDLIVEPIPYEKSSTHFSLSKQRSCSEFSRFENDKPSARGNNGKILGGSMRYTDKLGGSQRKSSSSSSKASSVPNSSILPGRLSVDENVLDKPAQRRTSFISNPESESDYGDLSSNSGHNSPAMTRSTFPAAAKRSGIEVSSKYLQGISPKNRKGSLDSNILPHPASADSSPKARKLSGIKNVIRRANSLTGHASQWAMSPGRTESPTMLVDNKGKPISFSNMKPPTSPSRPKAAKFFNLGFDFFKNKKTSPSQVGNIGDVESIHQLKLFHNRLMQWHYANARAQFVQHRTCKQSEANLLCAWSSLSKLQHSVSQKKLKLQKEKLEMKLNSIFQSHIKLLESWAALDRQHSSAISDTIKCLHSVVCRVPLIEGAKAEPESISMAIQHVQDLTAAIKSVLSAFSSPVEQTALLLSKLAEVSVQEKLLLNEWTELFKTISALEIQENSLRCTRMQSVQSKPNAVLFERLHYRKQ